VKDLIDLLISNSTQEYISDESEKLTSQPQSLTAVGSLTEYGLQPPPTQGTPLLI
jgi:hypothetical protein